MPGAYLYINIDVRSGRWKLVEYPLSTATSTASVVPTGSAGHSTDRQTWLGKRCTKRIDLPAHIFLKPFFKFAMRTVAVAATATVSDERCSLEEDWHITKQ